MTRFLKITALVAVLNTVWPALIFASGVSSTGAQFLEIPVGVRAAAMGEAFTAVADDATASEWNTAGLAQLRLPEFNLLHTSLFESLNYEFFGAAVPLRPGTTLGLSAALNHTPAFNSTNDPSAVLGQASDFLFSAGVAREFGSNLSVGVGGKFIRSSLQSDHATGFGLDAGILIYLKDRLLTLGLSAQNVGQINGFGQDSVREKLPATYRAGLAARFLQGKKIQPTLSVEVRKAIDTDPVFMAGTEVWVGNPNLAIAFRAGYQSNSLTRDLGGSVGSSFGTGVRFSSLQFDYAFVPYGFLGNTQRFSMTYRYGGKKPEAPEEATQQVQVDVKSQLEDAKTGSVKTATFDLKPEARTDIKNWALDITDAKGNIVRRYAGKGVPPKSLVWDGKDDQGNLVTGGIFTNYNLRTIDKRGQQVIASEPLFKINSSDLAMRGMDQRSLTANPELLASLVSGVPLPAPTETVPELPATLQPIGDMGAVKLPSLPFAARSSELKPGYRNYLDEVAKLIRKYPGAKVYIEGHAYDEGPENAEVQLSQLRADTVLRYLVEVGKVEPAQLYSRGHGSSAPMDNRPLESSRAKNRRVDIVLFTK